MILVKQLAQHTRSKPLMLAIIYYSNLIIIIINNNTVREQGQAAKELINP